MKKLDNNGFTLIELVATVVILGIVMGIGGFAITGIIKESKERDYELLIKEITSAVESYYLECKYAFDSNTCDSVIKLNYLVDNGFLKGNSSIKSDDSSIDGKLTLVNPNNNIDISNCEIKYTYNDGKISVEAITGGNCPTTEDYKK